MRTPGKTAVEAVECLKVVMKQECRCERAMALFINFPLRLADQGLSVTGLSAMLSTTELAQRNFSRYSQDT